MNPAILAPGRYVLTCRRLGAADRAVPVEICAAGLVTPPSGYPQHFRTFGPEYSFAPCTDTDGVTVSQSEPSPFSHDKSYA